MGEPNLQQLSARPPIQRQAGRRKDISDSRKRICKVPETREQDLPGASRGWYGSSQDPGWVSP